MLNPRTDKVNDLGKEWVARSIDLLSLCSMETAFILQPGTM